MIFQRRTRHFWADRLAQRGQGSAGCCLKYNRAASEGRYQVVFFGRALGATTRLDLEQAVREERVSHGAAVDGGGRVMAEGCVLWKMQRGARDGPLLGQRGEEAGALCAVDGRTLLPELSCRGPFQPSG